MRLAMRSRFWSSVRGMGSSQLTVISQSKSDRSEDRPLHFSHGALFDAFFEMRALKNGVHINPGRVHEIRINLAGLDKFFHFRDNEVRSRGHHGIQIASCFA